MSKNKFPGEGEEEGHNICIGLSLCPVLSGSILAVEDAKVGADLYRRYDFFMVTRFH